MLRKSTALGRWKDCYCELNNAGIFKYVDVTEESHKDDFVMVAAAEMKAVSLPKEPPCCMQLETLKEKFLFGFKGTDAEKKEQKRQECHARLAMWIEHVQYEQRLTQEKVEIVFKADMWRKSRTLDNVGVLKWRECFCVLTTAEEFKYRPGTEKDEQGPFKVIKTASLHCRKECERSTPILP